MRKLKVIFSSTIRRLRRAIALALVRAFAEVLTKCNFFFIIKDIRLTLKILAYNE